MREFNIIDRIQDAEFKFIENTLEINLPSILKDYLKKYGGMSIYESTFSFGEIGNFQIGQFLMFDEIINLSKEFLQEYKRKLVPFAYDGGGWHFCLSFDADTYGKIIINRWTDHLPEEQFLVIADSFEEFINGLKTEENV
jgi:SMI1-KNR4 cell-wall